MHFYCELFITFMTFLEQNMQLSTVGVQYSLARSLQLYWLKGEMIYWEIIYNANFDLLI